MHPETSAQVWAGGVLWGRGDGRECGAELRLEHHVSREDLSFLKEGEKGDYSQERRLIRQNRASRAPQTGSLGAVRLSPDVSSSGSLVEARVCRERDPGC